MERLLKPIDSIETWFKWWHGCRGKNQYVSMLVATKAAYYLEAIRAKVHGRQYNVYRCQFCGFIHIGRKNLIRRPNDR